MVPDEKFVEILKRLLTKSEANQVKWFETRVGFAVRLPGNCEISVRYSSQQSDPDWAGAELKIGDRLVSQLLEEDSGKNFGLLERLFKDAERSCWGWDKAIKTIEDA